MAAGRMLELGGFQVAAGADSAAPRQVQGARAPESFVSAFEGSERRLGEVLASLEQVIAFLNDTATTEIYTAKLLAGGVTLAGSKVAEEAEELVRAAGGEPDERVVSEAADLLYHTLVLLACRDVPLGAVEAELARRFGVSGLAEKAARATGGGNG